MAYQSNLTDQRPPISFCTHLGPVCNAQSVRQNRNKGGATYDTVDKISDILEAIGH